MSRVSFHLLSCVPHCHLSQKLFRSSRQAHLEGEAELAVDELEEIEAASHLLLNLIGTTEDVRIVLLETTHARQA